MQKDNYNKLSEKIEKLNFHAYKERIEIQRNINDIALTSADQLEKNGMLLKIIITLQVVNVCKEFPAVAQFINMFL